MLQTFCFALTEISYMLIPVNLVIGADQQERFMAFLVDSLPNSKQNIIGTLLQCAIYINLVY